MGSNIREFLSRVVPWPGESTPGYVNLHYTMKPKTGDKPFWSGKPTTTVDEFIEQGAWALKQEFVRDIYFCTSLQSKARTDKNGKLKPVRLQANAVAMKEIHLDVDVKDPPKGYKSLGEALDAIGTFIHDANLPMPTAMVGSGGGIHVYWISNRPLTLDEWRPYAEGLKTAALSAGLRCDAGCTIDSARVLRVPGTFNRKIEPARPVKLLGIQETDYDFSTALSVLPPLAGTSGNRQDGGNISGFDSRRPSAAFATLATESLAEGLEKEEHPLDPKPIMKGCAFLRNALLTGGKDYDQPMWNLTTLAATFIEDGAALAHKMGKAHPDYTTASTDDLWARKNRERKDRGLGWPSCAAIQVAGCKDCASCPHFKEKKSPLHLALGGPAQASTSPAGGAGSVEQSITLPDGFGVDKDGHICKIKLEEQEEGPPVPLYTKIFTCRLSMPWACSGPDALNFTTTVDKGHTRQVSVTLELIQMGGRELLGALGRAGVKCYPPGYRYLTEFLMAWLTKLHDAQEAVVSVPFGWWMGRPDADVKSARHGFVYGGVIMKDDGTEGPSGMGDKNLRKIYQPVGDPQVWVDACRLVNGLKRPELDAIIAASFASPLMVSPAEYSAMLSAWGQTGVKKSAALKVGLSVWGHPKLGKETTDSTSKSVLHKMGQIRHLPVYWDEIRNKQVQTHVYNTFFNGSEGVGGGRLTSNIEQREKSEWQNILVACSNISMVDFVVADQRTTTAGMYRVFEYNIPKIDSPTGRISTIDASRMLQDLESNYGTVGLKYAKILGSNPSAVDAFVKKSCDDFAAIMKPEDEERYWIALCGTLLAGAAFANQLGAQIDIPALSTFLQSVFALNRQRIVDEATEGHTKVNTEEALTGFLQARIGNALFTDTFPSGKGKPKNVSIVFAPDFSRPVPIYVQWAIGERKLRISRKQFVAYLKDQNISSIQVFNGLRDFFQATLSYAVLGAGTSFRSGIQEHVIQIPVPEGSPLEDAMLAHSPQDALEPVK